MDFLAEKITKVIEETKKKIEIEKERIKTDSVISVLRLISKHSNSKLSSLLEILDTKKTDGEYILKTCLSYTGSGNNVKICLRPCVYGNRCDKHKKSIIIHKDPLLGFLS
jgi:hypothetical protein